MNLRQKLIFFSFLCFLSVYLRLITISSEVMPENINQNPEQIARDKIDSMLHDAGWLVQSKNEIDLSANIGVAVREYQTDIGPADYVLFVERKPVGIIEAKREDEGHRLTVVEEQSKGYADSKLKYLENDPLQFVYESTGTITRFTDYRDPKPRGRNVFLVFVNFSGHLN